MRTHVSPFGESHITGTLVLLEVLQRYLTQVSISNAILFMGL